MNKLKDIFKFLCKDSKRRTNVSKLVLVFFPFVLSLHKLHHFFYLYSYKEIYFSFQRPFLLIQRDLILLSSLSIFHLPLYLMCTTSIYLFSPRCFNLSYAVWIRLFTCPCTSCFEYFHYPWFENTLLLPPFLL